MKRTSFGKKQKRRFVKNNLPDLMLSPLAGYTDAGFRKLAKMYGCGITVTEMVSAKALLYKNPNTKVLLFNDESGFKAAQLFGSEASVFAEVVKFDCFAPFDAIDINMGCPQRKIISNGEGCALMEDLSRAAKIIRSVKNNTDKLVSVKFRKGYINKNSAAEFAKMCADNGADYITVHGRTSSQQFSGKADYAAIASAVKAVNIPVFANGDVIDRNSYLKIKDETGCFGVAVGRGAIGKPYIFCELLNKDYNFDILEAVKLHINTLLKIYADHIVANDIKKHIVNYVKGMRNNKELINFIMQKKDTLSILNELKNFLNKKSNTSQDI